MELRVLKYFLMVARELNITNAADKLHITQPTLSRQISQLENELGVRLLQRGQHGISLTEDGMLLRRRAQEIVDLSDKTERELSRDEDVVSGEISIGSGETKAVESLVDMMSQFRMEYPEITFDIYTAMADDIKERLERGSLDIGVLIEPVDISRFHFLRLPGKEKAGVLLRADSPLAKKDYITAGDLIGTPLIIVKRQNMQNELAHWFGENYKRMEIVATYNLLYNAAVMVRKNVGIAVCIELDNRFNDLCFRPFHPSQEVGNVVVWKKEQALPAATRTFLEYVKKCLEDISDDRL